MQVTLQDLDDRLLVSFGSTNELRRSVALGTDTLAAQDVRLEWRLPQNMVEYRRGQFLGAGGSGIPVEENLRFGHQGAKTLGIRVP